MRSLQQQAESVTRLQKGMLVAALIFAVAFWGFVYRPQTRKIVDLQKIWSKERVALDANQSEAQRLPEVAREVTKLKEKLEGFDRRLPRSQEYGTFYDDVTNYQKQHHLRPGTWNPGAPRQNDFFSEKPVSVSFEGDFVSVLSFLRKVEDMPRLTRVRNLKMRGKEDKPGMVEVDLSMNIYYASE